MSGWTTLLDGVMAAAGLLFALRLAVLVTGAAVDVFRRRRRLRGREPDPSPEAPWPAVTVLIPAYNEERVLEATVRSALASDYPEVRVLVVDDGSQDGTAQVAHGLAREDARVEAHIQDRNRGKARALNEGLERVRTPAVVSLDADTLLAPRTLRFLVAPLLEGADACCCNLKVGNRRSWLLHWQSVEYVVGLNLGRRAQATLGCITTIPGAAAAFRREVLRAVGGWSSDTRTEDTDLTLSLLERGARIVYEPRAHAFTEAPATFGGLLRQRTRWMHGYLACIWKHRRSFLRLDALGLFGMPNLLFLHFLVFPLFLASMPYLFRVTRFTSAEAVIAFLVGYLWLDLLLAALSYLVDRERLSEVLHAPLWRLGWPFVLLLVFFRTWARILAGGDVPWNKLERTGELAEGPPTGWPEGRSG